MTVGDFRSPSHHLLLHHGKAPLRKLLEKCCLGSRKLHLQITTAPEHDGSLSGARLREAVSWGKVRPEAPQVVVEGDASVLLPLLGVDLFSD